MGTPFFHYHCGCMIEIRSGPEGVNIQGVLNISTTNGGEGPDPYDTVSYEEVSSEDDERKHHSSAGR
jgi:hypothetical protein